jgi:hypothetical protein
VETAEAHSVSHGQTKRKAVRRCDTREYGFSVLNLQTKAAIFDLIFKEQIFNDTETKVTDMRESSYRDVSRLGLHYRVVLALPIRIGLHTEP